MKIFSFLLSCKMIEKRITEFISEHHVLTLAVSNNNIPYCANCFYIYSNDDEMLIFTSDKNTRHISSILWLNRFAFLLFRATKKRLTYVSLFYLSIFKVKKSSLIANYCLANTNNGSISPLSAFLTAFR